MSCVSESAITRGCGHAAARIRAPAQTEASSGRNEARARGRERETDNRRLKARVMGTEAPGRSTGGDRAVGGEVGAIGGRRGRWAGPVGGRRNGFSDLPGTPMAEVAAAPQTSEPTRSCAAAAPHFIFETAGGAAG